MYSQLLFTTLGCDIKHAISKLVVSARRSLDDLVCGLFGDRCLRGFVAGDDLAGRHYWCRSQGSLRLFEQGAMFWVGVQSRD